jgi:hypothetical protein
MALPREVRERRATYLGLIGLFLSTFGAVAAKQPKGSVALGPLDLAMLGLSTFRLGRMVAYDTVLRPVREPFTATVPDPTGAGDTVEPEGTGMRRAIGELISCPTCAGTWLAALQVYALQLAPGPARIFIAMMAAVGAAELLGSVQEALGWLGQEARQRVGERERHDHHRGPDRLAA